MTRDMRANFRLLLFLSLLGFSSLLSAQDGLLKVNLKFLIDNGNRDGAKIAIQKDGQGWKSFDSDGKKESVDLPYGHEYLFTFSKPGYITKRIFFSTKLPDEMKDRDDFRPYLFQVTIFKQYDDVNITVYNQPVGRIAYSNVTDDFDYDTDYTKQILTQLKEAEKQIE